MKEQVKVVARTKNGEVLKGYAGRDDLQNINNGRPVYMALVSPGNTVGTIITQDQLEGLFIVKSFKGDKPGMLKRLFFDIKSIIRDNLSLISAAAVIAALSLAGLIFLL